MSASGWLRVFFVGKFNSVEKLMERKFFGKSKAFESENGFAEKIKHFWSYSRVAENSCWMIFPTDETHGTPTIASSMASSTALSSARLEIKQRRQLWAICLQSHLSHCDLHKKVQKSTWHVHRSSWSPFQRWNLNKVVNTRERQINMDTASRHDLHICELGWKHAD